MAHARTSDGEKTREKAGAELMDGQLMATAESNRTERMRGVAFALAAEQREV